jgi:hypothetical protein
MSSFPVTSGGIPEYDAILEVYAARIASLERLVQTLLGTGGRAAGCLIGVVQDAGGGIGIPAATDDDTPGVGSIMIRQPYPTGPGTFGLRDSGIIVPAFNIATHPTLGPIAVGRQIASQPILNTPGYQLVNLDPCPPT